METPDCLKIKVEGYLIIKDLLYVSGPVDVDGFKLDGIINVEIVQSGRRLTIESFEIEGDVVDMALNDGGIVYLSPAYNTEFTKKIYNEFIRKAEELAIKTAKETSENLWNYRLAD